MTSSKLQNALLWRHNEHDGTLNHRPPNCLLNHQSVISLVQTPHRITNIVTSQIIWIHLICAAAEVCHIVAASHTANKWSQNLLHQYKAKQINQWINKQKHAQWGNINTLTYWFHPIQSSYFLWRHRNIGHSVLTIVCLNSRLHFYASCGACGCKCRDHRTENYYINSWSN